MAKPYTAEWEKEIAERRRMEIKEGRLKWEQFIRYLFPIEIPNVHKWSNVDSIVKVLSSLISSNTPNHLFLPTGGGMELSYIDYAAEHGCIAFSQGGITTIMKPHSLTFYSFGDDLQWSFFRLESASLKRTDVYEDFSDNPYEELTEIEPGVYEERELWETGNLGWNEYGEIPLPDNARLVSRRLKGAYVIFGKYSDYNLDKTTDDGRHNQMSELQFQNYINKQANK